MAQNKKNKTWPFDTVDEYRTALQPWKDDDWNTVMPSVTFYVTSPSGDIPKSWPSLFWKFGHGRTDWPSPISWNQRPEDESKNVRFEYGFFTTSDPEVIWYLDHYHTWGVFEDSKRNIYINYKWEPNNICIISRKDPAEKKVVVETVETVVYKTAFPRVLLSSMDPAQLMSICASLEVDLSEVDKTVESIIAHLEGKWFVQG